MALGAPVRRHDGRVVAAISLGGPAARFTPAPIPALVRPLREGRDPHLPAPRLVAGGLRPGRRVRV